MTNLILPISVAFFCLQGCYASQSSVPVEFALDCEGGFTKASFDESGIGSFEMFVFDGQTGILEARGGPGKEGISLLVPSGKLLSFYAVANVGQVSVQSEVNEELFLNTIVRMEQFSELSIGMVAHGSSVFRSSSRVSLTAVRMASKISLDSIECRFTDESNRFPETILKKMYLTNVCTAEPLSLVPTDSGHWANQMRIDSDLSDTLGRYLVCCPDSAIPSCAPFPVKKSLFCMPNPVSNSLNSINAPQWAPRNTRLVIELSLDGQTRYYPVTLDCPMKSNTHYRIHTLRLLGHGSDSPDVPVHGDSVAFDVTVAQWEDAVNQNVTI